jgi:peptidoglycan biosynthesis protein MviN/MurJ (putative lipid II flippase)
MAVALAASWTIWEPVTRALLHISQAQSQLLYAMCFGLLGMVGAGACGTIPVAAFYASGDTHTPMTVGVLGFLVSIAVKLSLFSDAGLAGLAWATSIYFVLNLLAAWMLLELRVRRHAANAG